MAETKSYDFVFLRHGESVGNAEERFQGQSDFPLTETGREQARALADRWLKEGMKFDLVVTSPLSRAKETAEIIAGKLERSGGGKPDLAGTQCRRGIGPDARGSLEAFSRT